MGSHAVKTVLWNEIEQQEISRVMGASVRPSDSCAGGESISIRFNIFIAKE